MVIRNTAPASTVRGGVPLRGHVGLCGDGCSLKRGEGRGSYLACLSTIFSSRDGV